MVGAQNMNKGEQPMTLKEARISFCKKLRFAAIIVLLLTTGELVLGKYLERIMISPDLAIILIFASLIFAGVATLGIKGFRKF